jgi:hypothetical protein
LGDGSVLEIGLDARNTVAKARRRIFVGAGYPTLPGVRILGRGSHEEHNIIEAIRDYLDRTCGFMRREALLEVADSPLGDRDGSDMMAVMLMEKILER